MGTRSSYSHSISTPPSFLEGESPSGSLYETGDFDNDLIPSGMSPQVRGLEFFLDGGRRIPAFQNFFSDGFSCQKRRGTLRIILGVSVEYSRRWN